MFNVIAVMKSQTPFEKKALSETARASGATASAVPSSAATLPAAAAQPAMTTPTARSTSNLETKPPLPTTSKAAASTK